MQSRRGFIGTCAAALAAIGFGSTRALAAEELGIADFAAMIKGRFYFANSSGTAYGKVRLLKVVDRSLEAGISQFDLRFRGNRGVSLPEGMYTVSNWSGYPNFDVHIKLTGADRRGRELYSANFAQLR